MKLQTLATAAFVTHAFSFPHLTNSPKSRSLAALLLAEDGQAAVRTFDRVLEGLFKDGVQAPTRTFDDTPGCPPLPSPISDTSAKMVYDQDHPYEDVSNLGPCPGLNTLTAHGYLSRDGVDAPNDIITAVQQGFNMGYQFASFLTYSAFIVDGNQVTCQMSIGGNVTDTQGNLIPGLDTHGTFEGDASITRSDKYLGDNVNFNQSLFQVLNDSATLLGDGAITVEAGAYDRRLRIEDSIARNPQFFYETTRFLGATAETGFMLAMFASDQTPESTIPVTLLEAQSFFQNYQFPVGFYRRQDPYDFTHVTALTYRLIDLVGKQPGQNEGSVNNYVVNATDDKTFCLMYQKQAGQAIQNNQNAAQDIKDALANNLQIYYQTVQFVDRECPEVFLPSFY